jgi:hypothetical protein
LQPLNRAGPQLESVSRLINQAQDLIELKEAIPGFQGSFLIWIAEKLVRCRLAIALDVRPSHARASAFLPHDQPFHE